MTTNGTLDTRLSQNLVKEFEIPANKEYDKFNPHKIGGGNAIWITHIPPNVKVWFSTNQNFDNAQRLDYMNRGMRYAEIGSEGITRIYDNFYIFTEGTDENDTIKICVSTYGSEVEPILSSNTNQIDQVDAVGKIGAVDSVKQLYFEPPMLEVKIMGRFAGIKLPSNVTSNFIMFPLGAKKNTDLGFKNNKWYKVKITGSFDVSSGPTALDDVTATILTYSAYLSLLNVNMNVIEPITNQDMDNFFKADDNVWLSAKKDIFNLINIRYREAYIDAGVQRYYVRNADNSQALISSFNDIKIKGEFINSFDNLCVCWELSSYINSSARNESRVSLLCQFYELETL